LVMEMLINTDLSDVDTISGVLGRLITSTRNSINRRPHGLIRTRAMANRFARFAYNDYMRGVPFHQFLSNAQKSLENDPEGFSARLRAVRDKLKSKDDVVIMFAGNSEGIEIFKENAGILIEHLTDEPVSAADRSATPRPGESEGLVIDSAVQSNVVFATLDELGLEYSGALIPIMGVLSDAYLTPAVRYTIGAYGSWALVGRHGLTFLSYRDPSVTETFGAFEGAADFAANHSLTQDDINRYIIRSFSRHTVPEGELSGALSAIMRKYLGYPDDHRLNTLKGIKSVTVCDLTNFSKYLALAMEKGVRMTAGGQAVILENADLYESIVFPFGAPTEL